MYVGRCKSLNYLPGLHFLYNLFHLGRIHLPQQQSQVHRFGPKLKCAIVSQLNAMLIELGVLFEMRFELRDLSVNLLACEDGTLQFFAF